MPRAMAEFEREYVRPTRDFRPLTPDPTACFQTPILRNARKLARRHGLTPPSQSMMQRIEPGYYAQLATPDGIRFWVQILDLGLGDALQSTGMIGIVANELPADLPPPYAIGELIGFSGCNIYRLRPPGRAMMQ